MPIQVSEAIDSDTAEKITIERTAAGSYVNGIYQDGTVSQIQSLASVQQPTPEQLLNVEEGERTTDSLAFYSLKRLYTSDEEAGTKADTVIRSGKRYKIAFAGNWSSYGFSYGIGVRQK